MLTRRVRGGYGRGTRMHTRRGAWGSKLREPGCRRRWWHVCAALGAARRVQTDRMQNADAGCRMPDLNVCGTKHTAHTLTKGSR